MDSFAPPALAMVEKMRLSRRTGRKFAPCGAGMGSRRFATTVLQLFRRDRGGQIGKGGLRDDTD